jgi:HYR domain
MVLRRTGVAAVLVLAGLVPAAAHSDPPPLRVSSPTVEATGPDGADATYEVKAFDPTSGNPLGATCDKPAGTSGSGDFNVTGHFPLGQTTVTCNTTTEDSTSVEQSGTVTVQDTTPPIVTAPANVSASTNDPGGTTVTYGDASAKDTVDGSLTPSCSPASGSNFPVGQTTVTCSATDSHGNTGSATFTVTVTLNDTTPPVVSVPADFSVETESPGGRTVTFSASATDNADGPLTPSCSPSSGSNFPLGTTNVTCTATDSHNNTGSASFNVTVNLVDHTAPVVSVPASLSVSTSDPSGTTVTFSASASDNLDGPLTPSCSPSSGSNFPVGTTKVTCTATDSHNNTGSADFNVTVNLVDTTPPVVTVPASFSRNTPDPSGTTVTFSASANDNIDGPVPVGCSPSSGSNFPVGQTTVTCSATDSHGNTAHKSFTITVVLVDTTAPVVTVPDDISVTTPDPAGAAVSYTASATDNLDGPITPSCAPASGAVFPVGTTTVTCTAKDAHGNSGQATFKVTVVLVDLTPPVFSNVPGTMKREADGQFGSVVAYTAPTAVDNIDGPVPVTCSPPSGRRFALGVTKVHCTATDAHGNTGTAVFDVLVVDTVAPRLLLPPAASVYATSPGGIPRDDPVVQSFLNAAAATDLVDDHPSVTNDAPQTLPVGSDTITFTAKDASGNSTTGTAVLTVKPQPPPGTPQLPPTVVDRTPPDDVTGVNVKVGNKLVRIRWKNPSAKDFAYVLVTRSLPTPGSEPTTVYKGKGVQLVDRKVTNGISYRYVLVAFDQTGNASGGVAAAATPRRQLLTAPPDGAKVKKPPKLVWIGKASFFNVQIFRGNTKVLSAWPTKSTYVLKKSWKYDRRRYRMSAGIYRWFVWPAFGTRSKPEYGGLLGTSSFTYAP